MQSFPVFKRTACHSSVFYKLFSMNNSDPFIHNITYKFEPYIHTKLVIVCPAIDPLPPSRIRAGRQVGELFIIACTGTLKIHSAVSSYITLLRPHVCCPSFNLPYI